MPAPNYPPANDAERETLLQFVRDAPIAFGSWRFLKGLFKRVEADPNADPALLGALLARMDTAPLSVPTDKQGGLEILQGRRGNILSAVADKGTLYVLTTRDYYNAVSDKLFSYQLDPDHPLKARPLGNISVRDSQHLAMCGDYLVEVVEDAEGRAGCLNIYSRNESGVKFEGKIFTEGKGQVACHYPYVFVPVPEQKHRGRDGFVGLLIISIADPTKPQIVGSHAMARITGVGLSEDGKVAAVGTGGAGFTWKSLPQKGGFTLLDVSIPNRPTELGHAERNNVEKFYFFGKRLYVTTWSERNYNPTVTIYDVTDPRKPQSQKTWTPRYTYSQIFDLTERDGYLYVVQRYLNPQVIDVRNPSQIVLGGTLPMYISGNFATAFTAGDYLYITNGNAVEVYNISNPANPVRAGQPPKPETMGYMKRRARRILRNLSKNNPARFVDAAFETLKGSGASAKGGLDEASHWVSMDLLYGGGTRYYQHRHGRGGYSQRPGVARKITLGTREERGAAAWDAHTDKAEAFFNEEKLHWQVYEFAARLLRSQDKPLPTVKNVKILESWLDGKSPLLSALATRAITGRLEADQEVGGEALAKAFFWANATLRRRILSELETRKEALQTQFAERTLEQVATHGVTAESRLSRRAEGAALAVARRYPATLGSQKSARILLVPFARSEREELVQILVDSVVYANPAQVRGWISDLTQLTEAQREPILAALDARLQGYTFPQRDAVGMVMDESDATARQIGWRFLAASDTPQGTLAGIWNTLLELQVLTAPLRSAMTSPYAIGLLTRAGITSEDLAKRLQEKPFLIELLNIETFRSLVERAPTATILNLVSAMTDDLWQQARTVWLRRLREGVGLPDLWNALPAALDEDGSGRITARILNDADFEDALLGLEDDYAETVIAIRADDMDRLIARWLMRHEGPFTKDSLLLSDAATHVLPLVRDWGLARARSLSFGLPFALRLMESEIPASMAVGKAFFTSVASGGDREADYALALCDSPIKAVRRFGQEYVTERWEALPHTDTLRALFENPDPEIQVWIATLLHRESSAPAEAAQFHRDVLRQRNRGRKAKEVVKARQSVETTLDVATLLELARGSGTPRDAEWAMSQLAQRALAGEEIPGFALDGVAG